MVLKLFPVFPSPEDPPENAETFENVKTGLV